MPEWTRHHGGRGWRVLDDGRIVLEHGIKGLPIAFRRRVLDDDDGAIRTKGEPVTARTLLDEYGEDIEKAAARFSLPPSWVAAMVTIEALRIPGTVSYDPISIADEDIRSGAIERPLWRYRDRPNRVSAGLMQTLLSTARQMHGEYLGDMEPVGYAGNLDLPDLCMPGRSLLLGAAYMRHQADEWNACDPILLVGAYNAGGLYETSRNPWNLRTYDELRVPKFAAYHNDLLAVME